MPFTVTMPKLSPTMETGVIAKWHKKEGERVNAGDVLLEVSTDKATVEHTALDEGILRKILVEEGKEAAVNQPIAIFTEEASESIEGYSPVGEKAIEKPVEKKVEPPLPVSSRQTIIAQPAPVFVKEEALAAPERIVASPLAKKLAAQQGIDLSRLQGTGPRGRIVAKDLEKASSGPQLRLQTKQAPTLPSGTFEEIALTPIRKVISERLQAAKATIPHIYVQQAIDADNLFSLRTQLSELGIKVSYNDLMIKACALALREHPVINSGFNAKASSIVQYKTIDISVAVSIEVGLITPIVKNADFKSVSEISAEVRELAKKAKEGKLHPNEFQGGSFTISNLGMYGVTDFQAIINPPQAAILAVSAILDQPVIKNGLVVPGKVMNVTLSADHRVIDGVAAAQYLQTLKKITENPIALLI